MPTFPTEIVPSALVAGVYTADLVPARGYAIETTSTLSLTPAWWVSRVEYADGTFETRLEGAGNAQPTWVNNVSLVAHANGPSGEKRYSPHIEVDEGGWDLAANTEVVWFTIRYDGTNEIEIPYVSSYLNTFPVDPSRERLGEYVTPKFHGSFTAVQNSGTTLTFSAPALTGKNHFAVVAICGSAASAVTPPTGFTEVATMNHSTAAVFPKIYVGHVTGGSFTFTSASTRTQAAVMFSFTGIANPATVNALKMDKVLLAGDLHTPLLKMEGLDADRDVVFNFTFGPDNGTAMVYGAPYELAALGVSATSGATEVGVVGGFTRPWDRSGCTPENYAGIDSASGEKEGVMVSLAVPLAAGDPGLPINIVPDLEAALSGYPYAYSIRRDGQEIASGASGLARGSVEATNPNLNWTPDVRGEIMSVSKVITAVAIHKAVEMGIINLEAPIFHYLSPRLSTGHATDDRFCVSHLLRLMGNRDYASDGQPSFLRTAVDTAMGTWLAQAKQKDPGRYYTYQNAPVTLAGLVIEEATGEDYETWVKREVLAPCGVVNATCTHTTADALAYSSNTAVAGAKLGSTHLGSVGWVMSVRELALFGEGFRNGKVIRPENVDRLLELNHRLTPQMCERGPLFIHQGTFNEGAQQIHTYLGLLPDRTVVAATRTDSNGPTLTTTVRDAMYGGIVTAA